MTKLDFDDEWSRAVEDFNASRGAIARRSRIMKALALNAGQSVLDLGCGPGHQVFEIASALEGTGRVEAVDVAETALAIAGRRCSKLENVRFQVGEASKLPFDDQQFDVAMSSQVFEYLDDVPKALAEIRRVLQPGGRVLIHDTDWGTVAWHSSDEDRMNRIMRVWDGHLADPVLPRTLGSLLREAGFGQVRTDALVQLETTLEEKSASALLIEFIRGYVISQDVPETEAEAWAEDLRQQAAAGKYFCSWNEYIFTATRSS